MSIADDVEYFLKFPTYSQTPTSVIDDFVLVQNDANSPVVILLGWAGCQDKYLAKYSSLYEGKGCITLRCTSPLSFLFLRRSGLAALGKRLVRLLLEMGLNRHPVMFHVFSNGGAFLYQHVRAAMADCKESASLRVVGVVWDSAPGRGRLRSVRLALRAVLASRCPRGVLESLAGPLALLLGLVLTGMWMLEALLRGLPSDPLAPLRSLPPTCPQLFLYSSADRLVRARDVEHFAESRRAAGEHVTMQRFHKSPHVQHLPVQPTEYRSTVLKFLAEALDAQ